MAGKSAAKSGEVKAKKGTKFFDPAVKGNWTAPQMVDETTYPKLTSGGVPVLHKVEATFSFSGNGPPPSEAPVNTTTKVTLVGETTLLQKGLSNVIVDGDTETDSWGNELKASASGKLKTS
jgi:hypothetical protein